MAFCTNCGAQVNDGVQFCPACGYNMNNTANAAPEAAAAPAAAPKANAFNDFMKKVKDFLAKLLDTPDHTAEYDREDILETKYLNILSYLSILLLIPLFVKKNSGFTKFHCNQGLVLLIASVAYGLLQALFAGVIGLVFPPFGVILNIIFGLGSLVLLAACVLGIYYAATGKAKELPYIGSFSILK